MSFLSLKTQVSTFLEQQLDSTRQRLDSDCLMKNPTASRLTEPLDSLDSLDSNLEARWSSKKPCNIGNSVQEISKSGSFKLLKSEREPIQPQPYTTTELLNHYEKPLFNHLLACPYCHIEKAQYCINGYAMGSVYDALLLNREDAQLRRESLALQVDRACISGRSVYVPFKPIPF